MIESNTATLLREDFQSYQEYLEVYRAFCKYYGYKVRVFGGWKFFVFEQDYRIWKNQK